MLFQTKFFFIQTSNSFRMGGILAKEKLPEKEAFSEEESSDNEEERREVHNLQDFY